MKTALLIENGNAGADDRRQSEAALAVLRKSFDVNVAETTDRGDLEEALDGRGSTDILIVAGGDGSLHTIVQALYERGGFDDVVLGLIPLGTGNDFARGIGIPLDPCEAADQLCAADVHGVDLIVDDDGGIVINAVHLGATANASDEGRVWKSRLGKAGYAMGALIAGVKQQGLHLHVHVDGVEVSNSRIASVAINNGTFVGAGMPLGPDADPRSGMMDIHLSYAYGPFSRFGYALQVRLGRQKSRGDVAALRGRRIRVSGDPFTISTDGEISSGVAVREWTITAGAVRMLVPPTP